MYLLYVLLFVFCLLIIYLFFFFFQAEDGIRDHCVTGVQTCALPISRQCWFYIAVFNKRRRGGLGHGVREGSRGVYLFDGVGEATSRRRYLSSRTATARIQPPVPPTILMGKPMYVKRRPTSS